MCMIGCNVLTVIVGKGQKDVVEEGVGDGVGSFKW